MSLSLLDFFEHIFLECDFIVQSLPGKTKNDLIKDGIFSRAMIRSIEVIGEATKKLPSEFTSCYPHVA